MMRYEVTSVSLGVASTWEVEATNASAARTLAKLELREATPNGYITKIRPVGYTEK